MAKRENVIDSIRHIRPERVARDFGGSTVTGIHSSLVAELRDHFGLEKRPVKVVEPSSFLGWVDDDLAEAMGADTAMAMPIASVYGVPTDAWREWRTPWGQLC